LRFSVGVPGRQVQGKLALGNDYLGMVKEGELVKMGFVYLMLLPSKVLERYHRVSQT
jgi:hypothetical protein